MNLLRKLLPWLNVWENENPVQLEQERAEAEAHTSFHALIPLFGYFVYGNVGFWALLAVSFVYAVFKEAVQDGHLKEYLAGETNNADFNDGVTDIFFRVLPLPFLAVLFWVLK